jgi:hypothetical protein
MRSALHAALASLVIAGWAGCHPPQTSGSTSTTPAGAARLKSMPTIFIRVSGSGRLPLLQEAVTYELCVDEASGQLVAVRPPGTETNLDDVIPNVLRSWTWRVDSSQPIKSGVSCWVQRFTPATDKNGKPFMRAEVALPLRSLKLNGDDDELIEGGAEPQEREDSLSAIRILEQEGIRYVVLLPWLHVMLSDRDHPLLTIEREKVAGADPHLPQSVKERHRGLTVAAMYRLCFDLQGNISKIVLALPVLGANGSIVKVLKTWRYQPQQVPVCFMSRFDFVIN